MRSEMLAAAVAMTFVVAPAPRPSAIRPEIQTPVAARQPAQQTRTGRKEASVPFRVGETLTYDVSWSAFLVGGSASMTVAEKRPSQNSLAYAIVAEGRPLPAIAKLFPVYYRVETLVDCFTLLAQQGSIYSQEGERRETVTTRFDRRARKAIFERRQETTEKREIPITAQTQDGLALLYALRSLALAPGGRIEVPVTNDGALFRVNVEASGPERVRVPFGPVDALNLKLTIRDAEGQVVDHGAVIWISNDARRLPVKLQADLPVGSFVLALREAK